jgi:hypothetical protein
VKIVAATIVLSTHPPKEFYIDAAIVVIVAVIVAALVAGFMWFANSGEK